MGERRLFVYYRVQGTDLAHAIDTARKMQQSLCALHVGLSADLMRRPGSDDGGRVTLMETYAGGIDAARQDAIEAAARRQLASWTVGERHVEVFEPCA